MNPEVLAHNGDNLFAAMPWGTDEVFSRTLETVRRAGLSFRLLRPLNDMDCPDDLAMAEEALIAKKP
jgi:glycosyltransferase A (GT-A) superfamily protein (DUF2064 family)